MSMKLNDEEDLQRFIAQQRQRIAKERETLEKHPTSAVVDYALNTETTRSQQNPHPEGPPFSRVVNQPMVNQQAKPPTPQFFKLGDAYQKQKEKLNEELKHDYRKALAEKQVRTTGMRGKYMTTYEQSLGVNTGQNPRSEQASRGSDLGLSLPIRDHLSAKERLMQERNREYNQFKINKENQAALHKSSKGLLPHRLTTKATAISLPPNVPNSNSMNKEETKAKPVPLSYEELLKDKRRQEMTYRRDQEDDLEDKVLYRAKQSKSYVDFDDGDDVYRKRARGPQRRRRKYVERYYDDYDDDSLEDDDDTEELIRRLRARQRKRVAPRRRVDSEEEGDERLFDRVPPPREIKQGRRMNSAQAREPKQSQSFVSKENDLRSKSAPPDQEYTGLPIGNVPSANTVQRKKDEYKLELQRQMEEKSLNKKLEKELELRIDASGANYLEKKQANRLGELSPRRQKTTAMKAEAAPDENDFKSPRRKSKKKTSFRRDSSDSEEEEDERRRPKWLQRPTPNYILPPSLPNYYQPPPTQFPSPYDEAYYYYGSRNPLDPASVVGGPVTAPGFPTAYQGPSPMIAAASARNPGLSFAEATDGLDEPRGAKMNDMKNKSAAIESSLVSDETRDSLKKKEKMQQYQNELKQQMLQKEKEKQKARTDKERYDRRIEQEAESYNPWGRGGGGAPMKDVHGNLISDLRQMHLENEDLVRDPTKAVEVIKQRQQVVGEEATDELDDTQQPDTGRNANFGRSNPFEQKDTAKQKTQRDLYKEDLQKQIEERRAAETKRKEMVRLEDEKLERRMQEQHRRMQEELEEEKKKQKQKIEEHQRVSNELLRAAEERKQEEERRKREEQLKKDEEKARERERELQEKLKARPSSPPIRVHDLHGKQDTTPAPAQHVETRRAETPKESSRHQAIEQHPVYERTRSPQIAAVRQNPSRDSKRVSRELSALRKQLLSEQRRIENQLRNSDAPLQFGGYQPTRIKTDTLIDLARARQRPVQVRRPPTTDRPSSKALRDFSDLKHRTDDTASLQMFRLQHPETPDNSEALERQQQELIKTQLKKIETLRTRSDEPHFSGRTPTRDSRNGFTLIPPESRTSMLEAETTYIPIPDDDIENHPPQTPELITRQRKQSARERRRSSRRSENEGGATYRAAPDNFSLNSLNSLATLDVDRLANKNQARLTKLQALQGDEISLTDPDDIIDRFVNQHRPEIETPDSINLPTRPRKTASVGANFRERAPSVNTLDTELWLRPGTGPAGTTT